MISQYFCDNRHFGLLRTAHNRTCAFKLRAQAFFLAHGPWPTIGTMQDKGRKTMQEVESTVIASWWAVQSEQAARTNESQCQILRRREAGGRLLELLNLRHLSKRTEGTSSEECLLIGSEMSVSEEELWEWLFTAPPPFACLTFLDDVADVITKRQLFPSLAPFLAPRLPS